ncbi:MAG: porin family protein [Candidatus Margulisbacteria bacterium]|nr:porin family protein [Candidatus Margulisiibacteriota bacterium]MBU1616611.1 porin family protein [Candidatus Margulisiibacteriota bacterium]MBU1867452.1 porin family protein [Candidatus Margulisiibacteriota bacterium]
MKKVFVAALALGLLVSVSFAGTVNVSGRAGMFNNGGGSTSMMYGVSADYGITENLSVRGAVDTTSYDVGGVSTTYMPISVDLIYHQTFSDMVTPYAGAGLSYNSVSAGGSTSSTTGYQGEVGVKFALAGMTAGVEYRIIFPDASKSTSVTSSNAYIQGGFSQSFNI